MEQIVAVQGATHNTLHHVIAQLNALTFNVSNTSCRSFCGRGQGRCRGRGRGCGHGRGCGWGPLVNIDGYPQNGGFPPGGGFPPAMGTGGPPPDFFLRVPLEASKVRPRVAPLHTVHLRP